MELTIDQALRQGVAAHKEGKLQDAEKLYRAILKSQSNHPEANHNMGLLAVSLGKIQEAVPFLKLALETNPKKRQFWLSYIDALIKLGQLDNAKQVLQEGKASGLKGDQVDQLEVQLDSTVNLAPPPISNTSNPSKQQIDGLIALYSQGKMQEAVTQGTALASQFPNDPMIPNIMGVVCATLEKFNDAINNYNKAVKLKPDYVEAYNNLGATLNKLGKHEEAIVSYNKAIELKPDFAEAHYNLSNVVNEVGEYEEAIVSYNKAIELKPDYAEAHNNLGNTLNNLGRYEEAIVSYNKAIELKPDYAEAHNNLGYVLNELGEREEAINSYNKAIGLQPDFTEAYYNLGIALTTIKVKAFSKVLAKNYLDVLNFENIVEPISIVRPIITLLKYHDTIKEVISCNAQNTLKDLAAEFCVRLSKIPLFLRVLEVCPILDLKLEDVLIELRKILLLNRKKLSTNNDLLHFQIALAFQCFTNEFIYQETQEETIAIKSLEVSLKQAFSNNEEPSSYDIACLAGYRPLFDYPWAIDMMPLSALEALFQRQVIEVKEELVLKEDIPRLNSITDDVSVAVQNQYEENPYPRWVSTRLEIKSQNIKQVLAKAELQVIKAIGFFPEAPQILIAGCGTGQHALCTASRFKNSHVTAIDLSLSSLAYAKRKTEEFGVTNIDYLQADILDLELLDKQFDIIESAGVLHHMADPIAGWKALTDCLKPNGLMKIGLYSELARQSVVKAREMVKEKKILPDKEGMLEFRRQITKLNDPEIYVLENSSDFYSTSTIRDLLFHIQEHRFTIPQISEALDELNLAFMGFEFPHKMTGKVFKEVYPKEGAIYNLDKWHEYEKLNPKLFSGMYQFWAQKV